MVKPAASRQTPRSSADAASAGGKGENGSAVKPEGDDKLAPVSIKPLDIVVPDQIGRYTIGRRIGSGTCGVVHQALDNLLGREVAIKLSPMGEAHVSTGKVPGAQRAYQTEIIAAGRLTHQNIVTVHDAGQFEELNYLVMEVVEGKSLKEYGKGKTLLPVHEALRVIAECCMALDYSHQQGILHRDIKPANIMLANNGVVKLLDFGIAVGLRDEGELNRKGPTLGTPNYMSPEQILGRDLGPPSDFYSLATVLFELLTGRQLFKAKKVKDLFRTVVHRPAPRLRQIRPDLPAELSSVLARALEKKPEVRYQTGQDMARALRPFIEKFGVQSRRPLARQRLIRRLRQQSFFRPFSEAEISQLLDRVQVRRFGPQDTLTACGTTVRRLLVITDGLASIRAQDRHLRLLSEGDSLGEASFISGAPASHDVVALTDVKALELSAGSLSKLPSKVHLHFYRHVSELLRAGNALADTAECDVLL
ncbi:protein kinase domain-containing protein [Granulosicoccus sp. 3-233]|uniref:protein kinase domain-containing protein n=1 Tax=Granulosicoccus sp. 3-233 TaxID=3417969 RepID=UPI003D350DE6